MRAWLNDKETQNLAVAYPGDRVEFVYVNLPDDVELFKRVGSKLRTRPLSTRRGTFWCTYHGRPYADARPNLCAPGPASETCPKDPSTHRPRWPSCGSVITAHCRKGSLESVVFWAGIGSPKLPPTDCTVT